MRLQGSNFRFILPLSERLILRSRKKNQLRPLQTCASSQVAHRTLASSISTITLVLSPFLLARCVEKSTCYMAFTLL